MNKKLAVIIGVIVVAILIVSIFAFSFMPEKEPPMSIEVMITDITIHDSSVQRNDVRWTINDDQMFAIGYGKEFLIQDDVNVTVKGWKDDYYTEPFNFFNETNTLNFTIRWVFKGFIEVVIYENQDNVSSPYRWSKNIPNETSIQLTLLGTNDLISEVHFEGISGDITMIFRQIVHQEE